MNDKPTEAPCRACTQLEVVDTGHPLFPFMCLACGCWGPSERDVRHELDQLRPPNFLH
jgi:hypothetical protein